MCFITTTILTWIAFIRLLRAVGIMSVVLQYTVRWNYCVRQELSDVCFFDTHQARYERASQTHSHLVCTECGEIREVDLEDIDGALANMKFSDFRAAYVSTCIYGVCEKCRKRVRSHLFIK